MKLGKYKIVDIFKTEKYKTIYLAQSKGKTYHIHEYLNATLAEHEYKIATRLTECHADQFIDSFTNKEKSLLVQTPFTGLSSGRYFNDQSSLPEKIIFARSVLSILKKIHDAGVIYNNLSLENITIEQSGRVMLHNFLPATLSKEDSDPRMDSLTDPRFTAPERTQRVDAKPSFASDYYSFGILMYWLLTGKLPFNAEDLPALILLHVAQQPTRPCLVNTEISDNLSRIVEKLLEKAPSNRYKSIEGIFYDLDHFSDPNFLPGSMDMDPTFKVSAQIYGRKEETDRLKKAAESLKAGNVRLVCISGYSGVGKSTIVLEFQKSLPVHEYRFISGKFQQYKKDIPYFALIEAFNSLFDLLLLSIQAELNKFRRSFKTAIGDQGQILTSVFPKLELIVGKQKPVETLMGENAQNRFNYIFIKFINIIATRERPLILFLDDIQWTDLVSLNVLRAVLQNKTGFLLVILCYRSNEVDQHHPFWQWRHDLDTLQIQYDKITVMDLRPEDVSSLVADSLNRHNRKLSNIAFQKTNGNAFFVHQLLNKMADDNCFIPDVEHKTWQVDFKKISSLEISSNVVELMQARLEHLPVKVIDLMKVIGAVGHNVDLDVLSIVTKKGPEDIRRLLKQPFEYGLLNQKGNLLYFTHDKIQQACYQLNTPEELPLLHFTIADTLMRNEIDQRPDDLFNLVGHLDKGFGHISDNFEKYIKIYMKAAMKSKEISAYNELLHYVENALDLLRKNHPDTMRHHVYCQYHIALYLNSRFKEADAFFKEKLTCIQNPLLLRENLFAKISQDSMLKKYKQAMELGMSVLKPFGIELDIDPSLNDLSRHLDEMTFRLAQAGLTNISDLLEIEQKNNDEMAFICEIIMALLPASFFYNPRASCLLFFATIQLAIKNGVFEGMAYALSIASTPFILIRNDYRSSYRYVKFAVQVAAGNQRALGNSKHILALINWHWCKSMKDDTALKIAGDAHHLLVQGGDIQMAGYTYFDTVSYMWERGDILQKVLAETQKTIAFNEKTQNLHGTAIILPFFQMVKTLMTDDGDFCNFCREGFNEADFIEKNKENAMALCLFFVYKTQLAYMGGAFKQAYAFGCEANTRLLYITGFISAQTGLFYAALSACVVLDPADEKWDTVTRALDQMRRWSQGSADNFKHKFHFLEAEIARKKNNVPLAIHCYIHAIVAVRQNRFLHEKSLIYERFASFWEEQENTELCEYYAQEAIQDYERWGATRKSQQLRQKYRHIHFDTQVHDLDLLSVINAQNVLAQETDIRALLKQMMQILLEVSGAERGFLILKKKDWYIEAFKNIEGEEIFLESLPLHRDMLCVDMVNYVIRTGQPANLEQFPVQPENAYMTRVKPQSLIAIPAVVSAKIIAVIYLEHRQIKNTFTASRRETVKLLSTQIAISLNNAKIYNQLELRVKERTKELAAQNEALKIARRKADQANEAKSEFLNNMSHELRTPLIAVTGFSELLSTLVSDPKQKSYVDAIKTAGKNLVTLVNDVLDLSKIEAGKMDITYAPVNLRTIFMEIEQIFGMKCKAKKLQFVVSHCTNLPNLLNLDEIRIRQILLNLVGNAVKFTNTGGVTLSSHVKKTREDKLELTLSVQDTGIGIPKAEQELIFQSFEQQKNQDTAKYGGTGLGLAITRRLVKLMKGTITVTSSPNQGSRFEVRFFNVAKIKTRDTEPEKSNGPLENIVFNRKRILIVDTIESNRLFLQTVLSKMNLEVMTATNGHEAILLSIELTPDLILMDIKMPVMDGFEVVGILKNRLDTSPIPVIALTASPTREEKEAALMSGFAGYLAKPLDLDSLLAVITQYVTYKPIDTVPDTTEKPTNLLLLSKADQPDVLCRQLQHDILPCFENMEHAFVANEFKNLAEQLNTIGETFNIKEMSDMGNHMLDLLTAFDIKKMKECLTRYANIITTSIHNLEVSHE
nr:AAA family ATPase [uncultured Desulfobacter sp.]